jgi:sugar-specific transcriptional regulator TrmB
MVFEEQDLQFLTEIGFTKTQAKLYLTLLRLGKTDGKTLSKNANASRTVVYRTLDELQKRGLVEKEMAIPFKFKATPLKQGLQILMTQKLQQYEDQREKTQEFLLRSQTYNDEKLKEDDYKVTIFESKERILQIIKSEHDNAQRSVDILSTLQRWLQILDFCFESYVEALVRGVKYRVIIEKPEGKVSFQENVRALLAKPTFELRLSCSPLKTNAAIVDQKEVTFNFFPSMSLSQSPLM